MRRVHLAFILLFSFLDVCAAKDASLLCKEHPSQCRQNLLNSTTGTASGVAHAVDAASTSSSTPAKTDSPKASTSQKGESAFSHAFGLKAVRVAPTFMGVFDYVKIATDTEKNQVKVCRENNGSRKLCSSMERMNGKSVSLRTKRVDLLIRKIIPSVLFNFKERSLRFRPSGPLREPEVKEGGICAELKTKWRNNRKDLETGDVMMYVSAWPMNSSLSNASVWAVPCATIDGRVVAVAVNFNPSQIMDPKNSTIDARKVISTALQTSQCPSEYAVVMSGTSTKSKLPCSVCASVQLDSEKNRLQVKYDGTENWVECTGNSGPSALNQSVISTCPEFEKRCDDSTFAVDQELQNSRFLITAQHYAKYADEEKISEKELEENEALFQKMNKKTQLNGASQQRQHSRSSDAVFSGSDAKSHTDRVEFEKRIPGVIPETSLMERANAGAEHDGTEDPNMAVGANHHDTMSQIERKKKPGYAGHDAMGNSEEDGASVSSIGFSAALLALPIIMAVNLL